MGSSVCRTRRPGSVGGSRWLHQPASYRQLSPPEAPSAYIRKPSFAFSVSLFFGGGAV